MKKSDVAHIMNVLRQGTVTWRGRREALERARKKVREGYFRSGKPRWKFYWQCAKCREWFREQSSIEVDHVVEIGGFRGDWNTIIQRMFPQEESALQCLCVVCHKKKTVGYNATRIFKRKRPG